MKTSQTPVPDPAQQGHQESVDRFIELVGKKPESAQSEELSVKERGANGSAPDQKVPADNGVVDTLMGILHGEYTVDKLLSTLHGLVPIVDHIKQSIEASSVSIPSASTQLSSVTRATETATVTILDNLETLTASLTSAEEILAEVVTQCQHNQAADEQFGNTLNTIVVSRAGDAELANLLALWKGRDGESKTLAHIESIRQSLVTGSETLMQITMALQVQDITAQQIAGVLHLIEEVRLRLSRTLFQVEHQAEEQGNSQAKDKPSVGSFDMNATYSISSDRQTNADEIVQQWTAQQAKK